MPFPGLPFFGRQPLPHFEALKGDLAGLLSCRITYTHRLVCEVDPDARIVKVPRMWTH
jgi:Txe/YoeB family toxin of Txe-Axe toxin-antitoxin module